MEYRLERTEATFRRETGVSGAQVTMVEVGARGQFVAEIRSAYELPIILGALRLGAGEEARVIAATNRFETVTVEARTCVSDLLCAGFSVRAGEMARLRAA